MQIIPGTVCALRQYIVLYKCFESEEIKAYFIFPTMKSSMKVFMGLVGLSNSNMVENHCSETSNTIHLLNKGVHFLI